MKKIYSLLLLGGLLFFGVCSTSAANKLKGSWDSWIEHDFNTTSSVGEVALVLSTGTHQFGIQDGDNFYS